MRKVFSALGVIGILIAWPTPAQAYEDRLTIDFGLGAGFVIPDSTIGPIGPMVAVGISHGLNDVWSARGSLSYALHLDSELPAHVMLASAEAIYLVDVVQLVPFFGGGLSAQLTVTEDNVHVEPSIHLAVGFDYLITRKWIVGIDARLHWLPLSLASSTDPAYVTVAARVSIAFDR